jgi:aminoglycoside phosphotransferase (APT) family kinase protein
MSSHLSTTAVTGVLRTHLDPFMHCTAVERGPLGNSQETWFVDARGGDGAVRRLVLRRSAPTGTLQHTERRTESLVMAALAARGFPVPAVHWLETEHSALERPYFVMDRLPGAPASRLPGAEAVAVARELGGWLARLHAVEAADLPGAVVSADLHAGAATTVELDAWQERYRRHRRGPVPALGALFGWLEAHAPGRAGPARLLWGDPGPHNVLVDGGRITALLDWELTHAGDPLEDLGAALWACLGGPLKPDDVLAGYEDVAGPVDREALRWFEVLACVTRSVMLLAGVDAFVGGGAQPSNAALGQQLLVANLVRAAHLARWGDLPAGSLPAASPLWELRLRPDAGETVRGVARFLRDEAVPAARDGRLRRELKTAAALLDAAALRAEHEAQALLAADGGDEDHLEDSAARAERERASDRAVWRERLLVHLATQRALIEPLEQLYGTATRRSR